MTKCYFIFYTTIIMTPEKITQSIDTKKNEKKETKQDLAEQYNKLYKQINDLKKRLPVDQDGQEKETVKAIILIAKKLRDEIPDNTRYWTPERDDWDTFNSDWKNIELNVQFDPFDKNILTEKEIKSIGYNHFSVDDLAIVLEEKEEVIKKAIWDKDFLDGLESLVKQIESLEWQKKSIGNKFEKTPA